MSVDILAQSHVRFIFFRKSLNPPGAKVLMASKINYGYL